MKIKPAGVAVLTVVVLFGGIGLARLAGLWRTSGGPGGGSRRNNTTVVAGSYTPDDIRGSFTLQNVADAFSIEPEVLRQAFGLPEGFDLASLRSSHLERLYAAAGVDIGNGSVKLFVSCYTDVPLSGEVDSWLPVTAAEVIREARADLDEGEQSYLDSHTIDVAPDLSALSGLPQK